MSRIGGMEICRQSGGRGGKCTGQWRRGTDSATGAKD